MAKAHESTEETITLTRAELTSLVNDAAASAAGIAVKAALAAQAPTPERRRVDAQAQVDEHLASLRPQADPSRVKHVACRAPNGATFDARLVLGHNGKWRVVQLDNYCEGDVLARMPKGLNDGSTGGKLTVQAKEWIRGQYVGNLNRYVTDAEPLPVDVEEEARRAAAKASGDEAA